MRTRYWLAVLTIAGLVTLAAVGAVSRAEASGWRTGSGGCCGVGVFVTLWYNVGSCNGVPTYQVTAFGVQIDRNNSTKSVPSERSAAFANGYSCNTNTGNHSIDHTWTPGWQCTIGVPGGPPASIGYDSCATWYPSGWPYIGSPDAFATQAVGGSSRGNVYAGSFLGNACAVVNVVKFAASC
jgi:hypothetical protein